ncbi:MAG: glycosyltransferase [Candidatus Electryonea clarkiae]|nr:glycosyltransferase [Candidatus Electryonea clarkiae]MDP8288076.1 glycosyltransferase [Candidatus Electryonea clarkiae]
MPVRLIDFTPDNWSEETTRAIARNSPDEIIRVKTCLGWRLLDSPYSPKTDVLRYITNDLESSDKVITFGCGSGYLPEILLEKGIKNAVFITGSKAASADTFRRLDRFKSENLNIDVVASHSSELAWEKILLPFLKKYPECTILNYDREIQAYPALYGELSLLIEHFKRSSYNYLPKFPGCVLFPTSNGLLEIEVSNELERRGIKVIKIDPLTSTSINASTAWEILERNHSDLVISVNNQASDRNGLFPKACELAGIPWVTWMLDDPRFVLTTEEVLISNRSRWGFHWDLNGVESWKDLGYINSFSLPLATDPGRFNPGEGDPSLNGRIVFVGSPIFKRAAGYFAGLDNNPHAMKVVDILEEQVRTSRKSPSMSELEETLTKLDLIDIFQGESLRRLPSYVVQQANKRYRIEMLSALAHLNPVIYGSGWEKLLPSGFEFRGIADYNNDLPRIYRSDAIHLSLTNLQMRSYPNQRIFDAGACGRVVVGERLDGWSELFGDQFDELLFDNIETMIERIEWLLDSPQQRSQLGTQLQKTVKDKHLISHRIDTILSKVFRA